MNKEYNMTNEELTFLNTFCAKAELDCCVDERLDGDICVYAKNEMGDDIRIDISEGKIGRVVNYDRPIKRKNLVFDTEKTEKEKENEEERFTREDFDYDDLNEYINYIIKKCDLLAYETEDLKDDINNLRIDEWWNIIEDGCGRDFACDFMIYLTNEGYYNKDVLYDFFDFDEAYNYNNALDFVLDSNINLNDFIENKYNLLVFDAREQCIYSLKDGIEKINERFSDKICKDNVDINEVCDFEALRGRILAVGEKISDIPVYDDMEI